LQAHLLLAKKVELTRTKWKLLLQLTISLTAELKT